MTRFAPPGSKKTPRPVIKVKVTESKRRFLLRDVPLFNPFSMAE